MVFRNSVLLFIVILITGLALAASGCSSNQPETAEISAVEAAVEPALKMEADEILQAALPDEPAAESDEAAGSQALPKVETPVQEQTSDTAKATVESNPEPALSTPQADTQDQAASSPVEAPSPAESLPLAEPRVGFLAPDLTLTALDGETIRIADLRGKNILINYWVSWCIPCMDELSALSRVYQDYQDQNVAIITVNGIEQDELEKVNQVVADLALVQPVLLDAKEAFWSTYLVQFLPTSFFIDTEGVIRHIMLGSAAEDVIRSKIDQLIINQL